MRINKFVAYQLSGNKHVTEWAGIILKVLYRLIICLLANKVITEEQAEYIVE